MILVICLLGACTGKSNNTNSSAEFQQYYLQGEVLYTTHCSNCHQQNGTGLGLIYPPLNKSDFMENRFEDVLCLMRYGIEGEIVVNGKSYIQGMPGIPALTDLEIAQIATYIYNTWEHERGIIKVKDATTVLRSCKE